MIAFLIAVLSADGFIAKNLEHSPMEWASRKDRKFFVEMTKKAGVVVMGKNTLKTLKKPFPGRLNIVYSTEQYEGGIEITQKSPKELLADLEKRGFKEVAICGGQSIYTMFMKAGVVNFLYLTIEPVLFGRGMTLFNEEIDAKLQLASVQKIGEGATLAKYAVIQ